MITSLVLALREGLESALIIGIFVGVLRKIDRTDLQRPLWLGVFSAAGLSLLAALILLLLDKELEGVAEQIFEGSTLLLAAGVLTWMIFWMKRQSTNIKSDLETSVHRAINLGGRSGVFSLAFLAVFREGFELALYLTAASFTSNGLQTILGTLSGLFSACILGYLIYRAAIRVNLQRFFAITGVLLILFAAGLVAHSVSEFNEAGIIPAIISPIWNLSHLLADHSIIGTIFNTLFGYHSSPSLTEALSYSAYMLTTLLIFLKAKNIQIS